MEKRVAIIGTGWVGASIAISTLHSGVADEVLLNDVRSEVAEGEAMDLAHGASFYPSAIVRPAAIEEMADADAVVVTAGRGGRPGESRLELLSENAAVVRDIGERLRGCRGTVVMVSNPVDVLTRLMTEVSGLPAARVVGLREERNCSMSAAATEARGARECSSRASRIPSGAAG